MSITLETIVSSLDDARVSAAAGSDRFELCSALALGGLTPSLGLLQSIKQECDVPVMAMLRPREGGMCYTEKEFDVIRRDAELFIENGAEGLVFGFLHEDGRINMDRCRTLQAMAENADREIQTVFHRAFDVVVNPDESLEQLVELGITRILTSGRETTAVEGAPEIKRMVQAAGKRIQILPGGGLDKDNVAEIVAATGVDQVHLYLTKISKDTSVLENPKIYFGAHVATNESDIRVKCGDLVRSVRQTLDSI
ncbi:MAG TPA: copper homeostasis protein CutC [Verrucomicrobiales bacterium]|nr:copper homeostasis protein CutC [Verrucomicrobiales bacterium]HIL69309.1 copper homeostasis protein CutC [Verrucomicrobiota bacterium]